MRKRRSLGGNVGLGKKLWNSRFTMVQRKVESANGT